MSFHSGSSGLVLVAIVAMSACSRGTTPPPRSTNPERPSPLLDVARSAPPVVTDVAPTPLAIASAVRAPASSSSTVSAPAASSSAVGSSAAKSPGDKNSLPLPDEPWFHDRDDRYDDCVAPLGAMPHPHFPAPFATCDPRVESYSSPPTGSELHFHYRYFSAALTTEKRTGSPGVCCYMVWEFPRRDGR